MVKKSQRALMLERRLDAMDRKDGSNPVRRRRGTGSNDDYYEGLYGSGLGDPNDFVDN